MPYTSPKELHQLPLWSAREGISGSSNSMRTVHGVAIPKHMLSPLEEGYRTPTGEDYEHDFHFSRQHVRAGDGLSRHNSHGSPLSSEESNAPTLVSSRSPFGVHEKLERLEIKLAWRQRIKHFTWSFFAMTMATGGIANIIFAVPFRFPGLTIIGTMFFLLNLFLFIVNCTCTILRFYLFPETVKASLVHPTESLFVPTALVSFGTILINICQYGLTKTGPWLTVTLLSLFWLNVALAVLASSGIYLIMWSTQTFTIASMTPLWIMPAYPLLLLGPQAGVLSRFLSPDRATEVIIGGFLGQGIGYMVSLMIYAAFIYRLMTQKLPKETMRPGMFVSIGPSGFTCAGIISMSLNLGAALPADFMGDGKTAAFILRVMASWVGLWLWGLGLWFFIVSVAAHYSCWGNGGLKYELSYYSFVFPNTALIGATFAIGQAFDAPAIQFVGCVATCIIIVVWMLVFGMMFRAIYRREILYPQKGEDKDEGGFKGPDGRRRSLSKPDELLRNQV